MFNHGVYVAIVGFALLLSVAVLGLGTAAAAEPRPAPVPSAAVQSAEVIEVTIGEPADVRVWNRSVVTLRAAFGALDPEERVKRVSERILAIPAEDLDDPVTAIAATVANISGYQIVVGSRVIVSLVPEDVDPETGETLDSLVGRTVENLQSILRARQDQQRTPLLIRSILFSLAATVLFGLALWAILMLRRRALRRWMRDGSERPVSIRGLNLRPYFRAIEQGAIKLTSVAAGLVAAYLWLTFVLFQFPFTEPWGEELGQWLAERLWTLGLGALEAIPGLFTVLLIFLATRLVIRAVESFFQSVERGWLKVDWLEAETARATRRLVVVVIWIFALTVAYPYIPGSDSQAFKGIGVLVGLMISLGSAGFINQIMSGLVIVYSRSYKPGDFVRVAETEGTITEVGLLSTKLVTLTRQEVTVPNAVLAASKTTDYSKLADPATGSIVSTGVTIGYDTPWRQVHAMLLLAAERTAAVRKEPKPMVLQQALSDFYVEYQLLVSVERPEGRRIALSELHQNIQDVFNEYGVQIMSPHFEVQPEGKVYVPPAAWFPPPTTPAPEEGGPGEPSQAPARPGGAP